MSLHSIIDPASSDPISPRRCALGIMTKAPQPGRVKTRLTPPLTPEEASGINQCFLRDLAQSIAVAGRTSPGQGVAIYTPVGAEQAYDDILPLEFCLLPQRGNAFGERLIFAAEDLFRAGFESVCLINSDSPTVPASSFVDAGTVLSRTGDRLVIGPSDDGGYYLIGLKQVHRRLFEEIDWSTERVLQQTKDRAAELGLDVHLLPAGFDVDDHSTLKRLCLELLGEGRVGDVAPHTREFLQRIIAREGRARICPET